MTDLRQIISDGFRSDFQLADICADLRAEMGDRLEAHQIALVWGGPDGADLNNRPVSFLLTNALRSVLREATSNIIKHARADKVSVTLTQLGDMLDVKINDNGVGFDTNDVVHGEGLNNMAERVTSHGGNIAFHRREGAMTVHLQLPLDTPSPVPRAEAAQ